MYARYVFLSIYSSGFAEKCLFCFCQLGFILAIEMCDKTASHCELAHKWCSSVIFVLLKYSFALTTKVNVIHIIFLLENVNRQDIVVVHTGKTYMQQFHGFSAEILKAHSVRKVSFYWFQCYHFNLSSKLNRVKNKN